MQAEQRGQCLILLLCAWTFLAAGPALCVYGAQEKEQNLKAAWEERAASAHQARQLRHWNIDDTVTRKIDGKTYRFRCIDQNYADHMDDHKSGALFLCDEVIPANTGSRYEFETPGDRDHGYVYKPGPIVRFGDSADYKYSAVRRWLSRFAGEFADAEMVNTGVEWGYFGRTKEECWEQFPEGKLTAQYLGSQKMEDRLFILSVDEAYRYRNRLWKFGPVKKCNPETQISEFCKGYWLRTPCGAAEGDQIYIVDLVRGNIRPEAVQTVENEEQDDEMKVTGTTGVRPAFVLPQKN